MLQNENYDNNNHAQNEQNNNFSTGIMLHQQVDQEQQQQQQLFVNQQQQQQQPVQQHSFQTQQQINRNKVPTAWYNLDNKNNNNFYGGSGGYSNNGNNRSYVADPLPTSNTNTTSYHYHHHQPQQIELHQKYDQPSSSSSSSYYSSGNHRNNNNNRNNQNNDIYSADINYMNSYLESLPVYAAAVTAVPDTTYNTYKPYYPQQSSIEPNYPLLKSNSLQCFNNQSHRINTHNLSHNLPHNLPTSVSKSSSHHAIHQYKPPALPPKPKNLLQKSNSINMGSKRLGDFWQNNIINSTTKENPKVGWNYNKIMSKKPDLVPSEPYYGYPSNHPYEDKASNFYSHANSAFSPVGSFRRISSNNPSSYPKPFQVYKEPVVPVTKSSSNSSIVLPSVNFNNLSLQNLTKSSSSSCIYAKSLNQPSHLRKNNDIFSTYKSFLPLCDDISDAGKIVSSNADLMKKPSSSIQGFRSVPKPSMINSKPKAEIMNLEDNIEQSIADIYKVGNTMYGLNNNNVSNLHNNNNNLKQQKRPLGWTQIAREPAVSVFAPTSSLQNEPLNTYGARHYVSPQVPPYNLQYYQPAAAAAYDPYKVYENMYDPVSSPQMPSNYGYSGYYTYTQPTAPSYAPPDPNTLQNDFNSIESQFHPTGLQAPGLVQKVKTFNALERQDSVRSNLNPEAKNFTPLSKSATMKYFSSNSRPSRAERQQSGNFKTNIDEMMSYQQDLLKAIEPYFNQVDAATAIDENDDVPSPSKSDSSTLTSTTTATTQVVPPTKKDFDVFYDCDDDDNSDLDTDDEADADDESEEVVNFVAPKKLKKKEDKVVVPEVSVNSSNNHNLVQVDEVVSHLNLCCLFACKLQLFLPCSNFFVLFQIVYY